MDCVFCKIVAGEIPADKVYEDDAVTAFLDIAPINFGHTLVVPKRHYPDLLSTPPELAARLLQAVQHIAPAISAATQSPAFNVGINNGRDAGQIIDHVHLHLIPRHARDGLHSWRNKKYGAGEAKAMAQRIAAMLGKGA